MLKKFLTWGLYAAFLGILLAGAFYRTSVKLADNGQEGSIGNASRQQQSAAGIVSQPEEEHQREIVQNRSTVDGQVVALSNRGISVQLADGQLVEIAGRAWRYAQSLGFSVSNGDRLQIEGFYENETFQVMSMTNPDNAQSVAVRDETGHPLWSGNE